MPGNQPIFYDTKTIIVNLLNEDKTNYLSINRLKKLLVFIYKELDKQAKLSDYEILFDVNFDSIERTVIYNNSIFALDIKGENIILKEPKQIHKLAENYQVDNNIKNIIHSFHAA